MDVQLGTVLAAVVPSVVVGLVGFLLKAQFSDLKAALSELKGDLRTLTKEVADYGTGLALHDQRLKAIETDLKDLDEKVHRLQSRVTDLALKVGLAAPQ